MTDMLGFLRICGKLKKTARAGWVRSGVPNCEKVSDHSWRAGIIAMTITDPSIRRDHLVKMAMVHDLAEAIVGDITPHDGVSDEDKHAREAAGMKHIESLLGENPAGKEIRTLWEEYEKQETAEAKLLRDIDRFEMIVQADEYEETNNMALDGFFDSTAGIFKHPEIRHWDDLLRSHRDARRSQGTEKAAAADGAAAASQQ